MTFTSPQPQHPGGHATLPDPWLDRRKYWQRKLRRLRLEAEPIDEQLRRYLRVTGVLTAVAGGIALIFLGLFLAFERPDIGLIVAGVLFLPIAGIAWLDYALLHWRARRYLAERLTWQEREGNPGRSP